MRYVLTYPELAYRDTPAVQQCVEGLGEAAIERGHTPTTGLPFDFAVIVGVLGVITEPPREESEDQTLMTEAPYFFCEIGLDSPVSVSYSLGKSVRWVKSDAYDFRDVLSIFGAFLSELEGKDTPHNVQVAQAMESVSTLWEIVTDSIDLPPDDRRIGDALAKLLGELSTVDRPPDPVVRAATGWFRGKADVFTEAFAKSAGKTLGAMTGVGVAGGVALTVHKGLLPSIEHLWRLLNES